MRIGEFAEICGTKISVLRHYDKEGLFSPDFTDRFTGYRYYSAEQIITFKKITALKKAGFSLKEIKSVLLKSDNTQIILDYINAKKSKLTELLAELEEAQLIMLGGNKKLNPNIVEKKDSFVISLTAENAVENKDFYKVCRQLEEAAEEQGYQRISNYITYLNPNSNELEIRIDVIKLKPDLIKLNEDINVPFEDDDIVGKWMVIGEYYIKEDFFAEGNNIDGLYGDKIKEIYFLPGGKRYWAYGWTKGFLICDTGDGTSLNSYELETHKGERYMFIQHKSYYYRRGGRPTVLVLCQLDNRAYTSQEIARKDNVDLPFEDDRAVLGKWTAVSYIRYKEDFNTSKINMADNLYFKSIEFIENGSCVSIYGEETISGDMQSWTKGYVLRKWNSSACAYEIIKEDGTDYLIMEWKSGDYRWGGFDTDYYVFIRDI